jgi:hypothetical protein
MKEKMLSTLRELVYQGIVKIEINQQGTEPVYKAARFDIKDLLYRNTNIF